MGQVRHRAEVSDDNASVDRELRTFLVASGATDAEITRALISALLSRRGLNQEAVQDLLNRSSSVTEAAISLKDNRVAAAVIKEQGIAITNLCYIDGLEPYAGCRSCLVEIEGATSHAEPREPWPDDLGGVYRALLLGLGVDCLSMSPAWLPCT